MPRLCQGGCNRDLDLLDEDEEGYSDKCLMCEEFEMDDFEMRHLQAWLDRSIRPDDQGDAKRRILNAVQEDPSVKEMGWPAIERSTRGTLVCSCASGSHCPRHEG